MNILCALRYRKKFNIQKEIIKDIYKLALVSQKGRIEN